jgi:hypothetical protein
MPTHAAIRLAWTPAPGEFVFDIGPVHLQLALEAACNAGATEVLNRLQEGKWRFNDVRETIRLALIGGGKTEDEALALVKAHVDNPPPAGGQMANALVAHAVIQAWLVGVPGDNDLGKKKLDGAEPPKRQGVDDSSVRRSTVSEPR